MAYRAIQRAGPDFASGSDTDSSEHWGYEDALTNE
jgi:hypothetical protein